MECIIEGCHNVPHNNKDCSYHIRLRLYGLCKNGCSTPAQGKHELCSRCVKRGGPPIQQRIGHYLNTKDNRYCWNCKTLKLNELFPKNKSNPSGLSNMCKNCLIIRNRGYDREEVFLFAKNNTEQGHSCAKCKSIKFLEVDHIVPVSLEGSHNLNNLQILCRSCNRKKKNLEKIDYRVMI